MPQSDENIVRHLLTAIEDDASVSQRELSSNIGIAVGSVNWYLKRCVNKGLVKLQQAPVKRYLYYLTPKGFEEKARLTTAFLQGSFELYRRGRKECEEFFADCATTDKKRIFLAGDGDFAEVAMLSSLGTAVVVAAVVDPESERDECVGVPIIATLAAAIRAHGNPDAILLTNLSRPREIFEQLMSEAGDAGLKPEFIHAPRMLNIGIRGKS